MISIRDQYYTCETCGQRVAVLDQPAHVDGGHAYRVSMVKMERRTPFGTPIRELQREARRRTWDGLATARALIARDHAAHAYRQAAYGLVPTTVESFAAICDRYFLASFIVNDGSV